MHCFAAQVESFWRWIEFLYISNIFAFVIVFVHIFFFFSFSHLLPQSGNLWEKIFSSKSSVWREWLQWVGGRCSPNCTLILPAHPIPSTFRLKSKFKWIHKQKLFKLDLSCSAQLLLLESKCKKTIHHNLIVFAYPILSYSRYPDSRANFVMLRRWAEWKSKTRPTA